MNNKKLKRILNLEYIVTIEEKESTRRIAGFAEGRLVVGEVEGTRCTHEEMPLGNALYQLFKDKARTGHYEAVKEYAELLSSK